MINIRKLNIIDENILFELDYDNHKITNTFIGNSRIVTIDNFFKNPSDVVDFAYKTPFSKSEQISAKFPGMRSKVWTDTAILNNFYQKILIDEFKETQYKPNITNINVNAIDSDFQGDFKNLDINSSFLISGPLVSPAKTTLFVVVNVSQATLDCGSDAR